MNNITAAGITREALRDFFDEYYIALDDVQLERGPTSSPRTASTASSRARITRPAIRSARC